MSQNPFDRAPAWTLAVTAMLSVQLGAAISVGLFDEIGVAGTAWLRISLGALGFVAIARPRYSQWSLRELRAPILLGLVSATMTVTFLEAIDRIPLGTAVAIEFLGPLTVATFHAHARRALVWPALALIGVALLTEPWHGNANTTGILLAAAAGAGWGLYIVITQHVGDRFNGVDALAISLPVAAIATVGIGLPQVWGHLSWTGFGTAVVAALLLPLLPWSLELFALRRLTKSAFGTLMSLEPAIALVIGIALLGQNGSTSRFMGIGCVVLAGVGAERIGHRDDVA